MRIADVSIKRTVVMQRCFTKLRDRYFLHTRCNQLHLQVKSNDIPLATFVTNVFVYGMLLFVRADMADALRTALGFVVEEFKFREVPEIVARVASLASSSAEITKSERYLTTIALDMLVECILIVSDNHPIEQFL
ncbi:hypothetical protein DPMN_097488 [Dreissena polymorpha]|uniref:Uncharacterized protein n=1 Tax=Dreissena polymorpha TaxID=45954 RepID=A0A9D4R5S6_DREPO|nr:hypothetical protein DPMN_097488 [Dreissena polymorpha]